MVALSMGVAGVKWGVLSSHGVTRLLAKMWTRVLIVSSSCFKNDYIPFSHINKTD